MTYLQVLGADPRRPLLTELMQYFPSNRPLPLDLAKRYGIARVYLKVQQAIVQYPTGWTPAQIATVGAEIALMQRVVFRQPSNFYSDTATKIALTFFSLTPTLDHNKIPLYLYSSLVVCSELCPTENEPSWLEYIKFVELWQEALGDPGSIYILFNIDGTVQFTERVALRQAITEIVVTLNFNLIFA